MTNSVRNAESQSLCGDNKVKGRPDSPVVGCGTGKAEEEEVREQTVKKATSKLSMVASDENGCLLEKGITERRGF